MSMYPIQGGKVEINVDQIVSAHKMKGGDEWQLFLADDKTFVVPKHEYMEIRALINAGSGGGGGGTTPINLPQHFVLNASFSGAMQGTVDPV